MVTTAWPRLNDYGKVAATSATLGAGLLVTGVGPAIAGPVLLAVAVLAVVAAMRQSAGEEDGEADRRRDDEQSADEQRRSKEMETETSSAKDASL